MLCFFELSLFSIIFYYLQLVWKYTGATGNLVAEYN